MKSIRNILLVSTLLLSANLLAGSVVIKNGGTDITNGVFNMPQVTKVGDAATVATLTVVKTGMASLSLVESGDDAISAVLGESSISLTFNPTDVAGQFAKVLTLTGLDTDGKTVSVKVTVNAVCLWGGLSFHTYLINVENNTYQLAVDMTSYKGFSSARFDMYIYGTEYDGGSDTGQGQSYDLTDEGTRPYFLIDDKTFSISAPLTLPTEYGNLYFKLTFVNEDGGSFSQYVEMDPTENTNVIDVNKGNVSGFDLSSCYDETGVALMDTLYLLSDSYCAIYAKGPNDSDGKPYSYVYAGGYNPAQQKRIIRYVGGKKLYFSGTCHNAKVGEPDVMTKDILVDKIVGDETFTSEYTNLDGAFTIMGGGSERVDLYLESLTLKTQSRNGNLCNNGLNFFYEDMPGGSSPFAVWSSASGSGSYFNVNFHTKGENKLISQSGVNFYLNFNNWASVLSDGFTFGSAPIAIRGAAKLTERLNAASLVKYNTQLNFDDYWIDGTATNGLLELDNSGQTNVGSIDLGNDLNKCNFFGGRYKLSSAATRRSSMVRLDSPDHPSVDGFAVDYFLSNSLAINYRKFEITLNVFGVMDVPICMYGFGNDAVGYGQVNFLGGTFETYGVSDSYMSETNQKYEYCYFRDKYDLRIPDGSQINGGTFNNCNVYLCDTVASRGVNPINFMGDTVCKLSIPQTGVNVDGTVQFTIPSKFKYDIEGMGTFTYNDTYGCDGCMSSGGVNSSPKHGINADASGNVNIYVPCEMDENLEPVTPIKTKFWWNTVMPKYSANPKGGATIDNSGELYNCFFIDVVLDTLVFNKGQIIAIKFNSYRGELYNKDNSLIQRRLYLVMPVETNRWYNFIAPFDISNVYEVSTTAAPTTPNASSWSAYRNELRDNNYNLIIGFAPQLIFGGHMDLLDLVQTVGDSLYNKEHLLTQPVTIKKLTYYNGTNEATSDFYLYIPQDSVSGTRERWRTRADGDFEHDYYYDWSYITPVNKTFRDENGDNTIDETTSNADVIMEAKRVYGLSFPGDQDYPYWNNRYLIFEGYGMQTVYGSDEQANFVTSAPEGYAQWGGNYTFTDYAAQENMYMIDNRDTKLKNGPGNNKNMERPEGCEYHDYELTEDDKYMPTDSYRDTRDKYSYDEFISECKSLIPDGKGGYREVRCSYIDTVSTKPDLVTETTSICFDEDGNNIPCSLFDPSVGYDTALVDLSAKEVSKKPKPYSDPIELNATISYFETYDFYGCQLNNTGTYTHTIVYDDRIQIVTLNLTVTEPERTISDYVHVPELSDEQIEGIEYVTDEDTYLVTNNIQPHFAYMVVNRPSAAPTRYTGMTDDEELSGLPTIANVSYVITEIGGIVNIETNYRQTIRIFDMTGRMVFSRAMSEGDTFSASLPTGVYIVSGATDNVKIIIK